MTGAQLVLSTGLDLRSGFSPVSYGTHGPSTLALLSPWPGALASLGPRMESETQTQVGKPHAGLRRPWKVLSV